MTSSVELYVYDLSGGMARQLSRQVTGRQIDGIWCVFGVDSSQLSPWNSLLVASGIPLLWYLARKYSMVKGLASLSQVDHMCAHPSNFSAD
jgi:hypothetical protein